MATRVFKKQWLLENVFEDEGEGVDTVADIDGGRHRWHTVMLRIFSFEGKFYGVKWNLGATENQENEYLEDEEDDVELKEMVEAEKVVKFWVAAP